MPAKSETSEVWPSHSFCIRTRGVDFSKPMNSLSSHSAHFLPLLPLTKLPIHFLCSFFLIQRSSTLETPDTPPTSTSFESFASPLVHLEASPIHLVHPYRCSTPLHFFDAHTFAPEVHCECNVMGCKGLANVHLYTVGV